MWAQAASAALGLWLMASPAVLGYTDPARTNDQLVGPLAFAAALIACWEVTRPVRWVNLPLGLWLLVAPWLLHYGDVTPALQSLGIGAVLALLAPVRGTITQRFGGGWSFLWAAAGEDAAAGDD